MFNQIFAIMTKEFKVLLHDTRAFSNLFMQPIAFILVMTVALQGVFDSGSGDNPIDLMIVNQDQGTIASQVITDLRSADGLALIEENEGMAITQTTAEDLITSQTYSVALVFPSNFSESILKAASDPSSEKAMVTFIADPTVGNQLLAPINGLVEGYIEREASQAQAPIQIKQSFNELVSTMPASQAGPIQSLGSKLTDQISSSSVKAENLGFTTQVVTPAKYQSTRNPSSAEQNVPGYTIYGVFLIITTISTSLFREKGEGTLRRLQAAPISRAIILTGKLLPYYLINLIQIVLMLTIGLLVFHVGLGNHPLVLIPLSLTTAAAATGMGLLMTSLGRTQEQVLSLSIIVSIILSVLGGLMIPLYVMPEFMQKLSMAIPHAWALRGFLDVMVRGQGFIDILPILGILMGYALVFWAFGLWRFRMD